MQYSLVCDFLRHCPVPYSCFDSLCKNRASEDDVTSRFVNLDSVLLKSCLTERSPLIVVPISRAPAIMMKGSCGVPEIHGRSRLLITNCTVE